MFAIHPIQPVVGVYYDLFTMVTSHIILSFKIWGQIFKNSDNVPTLKMLTHSLL